MALSNGELTRDRLEEWLQELCDRTDDSHLISSFFTHEGPENMSGTPKTVAFAGTEPSSYIESKTKTLETLSPLDSLSNHPTPQWSIPRSGQSSRGRYGSEFTKSAIARMAGDNPGDECWMCNIDRAIQHCHVIGIADRQSKRWIAANAFPPNFQHRDSSNGIIMCANCHGSFDDGFDPGLAFFPADLNYFIEYEKRDAEERNASERARQVPTAEEYRQYQVDQQKVPPSAKGGLYRKVYFSLKSNGDPNPNALKTWHGEPMYAIRRAIHVLGTVQSNMLPREIREQLVELQQLYFFNDKMQGPDARIAAPNREMTELEPPRNTLVDDFPDFGNSGMKPPFKRHMANDFGEKSVDDNPSPTKRSRHG